MEDKLMLALLLFAIPLGTCLGIAAGFWVGYRKGHDSASRFFSGLLKQARERDDVRRYDG